MGAPARLLVVDDEPRTAEVTVLAPGAIPRSEGKARRVIDLREL